MKEMELKNVVNCPVCGGSVMLRRNASKLFQVMCSNCRAHTGWYRKTDAVINWYNMVIQYTKNNNR